MDSEDTVRFVEAAKNGDKAALASLISQTQDYIYSLALRFLWNEEDAKEAAQEILVKVVTHLSEFRETSQFSTWCYRIATNHLLDVKKSIVEKMKLNQDSFEEDLHTGLSEPNEELKGDPLYPVLLEEIRIGCTTAMLNCLDRNHRIVYIIGEILEIESGQASLILSLTPSAFRKRLERARRLVEDLTKRVCGIIDSTNRCNCRLRLPTALAQGRVAKDHLTFAGSRADHAKVVSKIRELQNLRKVTAAYQTGGIFKSPNDFAVKLRLVLDSIG